MTAIARRAFLQFLAASPWLAHAQERALASSAEALDIFDLEAAARRLLPPAHWGYLQSGVDGDVTARANETAYGRYELRPRRLVDVSHIDLGTEVLGTKIASPIFY